MRTPLFMALVLSIGLGASAAYAQPAAPYTFDPVDIQRKAAYFLGGLMGFAAVECKLYTANQVAEMKRQQIQKAVSDGLPAAQFEAHYAEGYTEVAKMWKDQPASSRAEVCAEVEKTVGSGR